VRPGYGAHCFWRAGVGFAADLDLTTRQNGMSVDDRRRRGGFSAARISPGRKPHARAVGPVRTSRRGTPARPAVVASQIQPVGPMTSR
jgi:hypothetical protein